MAAADDERMMAKALALAGRGRGAVEPNPMVGAVIARGRRELACGWHRRFGGPHAEIEALTAARAAARDVRGAALYVTLEPCCRHGKTPPCTEAVIAAGIARVVAAMEDPDPRARGEGFRRLRRAGVEVCVGVGAPAAGELLAPYTTLRTAGRPWVICKWAQTADGLLALPPGRRRWISNWSSRRHAHALRGRCDGVLVGVGTVLADDPLLTNRSGRGRRPARVVLDASLRTPPDCRLVRTADQAPVLIATTSTSAARAAALRRRGAEVLAVPAGHGGVHLPALLAELGRRQWTYLLVEGGERVLRSFLSAELADELAVYVSPLRPAGAAAGLPRLDVACLRPPLRLRALGTRRFGDDQLLRFRVERQRVGG
jgi:diaminohydroxyphosphoribosylaminopyrimidine deaminase/5-amino-6-(5-phosphoribosylamino)uracil reductase